MAKPASGRKELLFLQRLMGEPIRITLEDDRVLEGDLIAIDGNNNLLMARTTVMVAGEPEVDRLDEALDGASEQLHRESKPFIGVTSVSTSRLKKIEIPPWALESPRNDAAGVST